MSNDNNNGRGCSITIGGGFSGLLTIAFIVLKLLNKIDWSWWWVLSPLWITAGLGLIILIIFFIIFCILNR